MIAVEVEIVDQILKVGSEGKGETGLENNSEVFGLSHLRGDGAMY